MRSRTTIRLFEYFNDVRGERSAPLRAEIDPAALKNELPDLLILEMGEDNKIIFRLAGTRACSILGHELRGTAFDDIWSDGSRRKVQLAASSVMATRRPAEIKANSEGKVSGSFELLLLPLFSKEDKCDRIFGALTALQMDKPNVENGTRLVAGNIRFLNPDSYRAHETASESGNVGIGVSLPQAPSFLSRIMHLRVFEGGRRDE